MIFQYVGENALKGPPIDPEKIPNLKNAREFSVRIAAGSPSLRAAS